MGIVNRRNAVLGWSVWKVGKRVAKRKAKNAMPSAKTGVPAGVGILGAIAAVVFFWRKRGSDGGESG